MSMAKKTEEARFQWSIQKSIKVKSIPFLLRELHNLGNALNLEMLENDFNWKFHVIESENVAVNQRPFMRTMFFIKEDLGLLNDDYTIKKDVLKSTDETNVLYVIYNGAISTLVPFKTMIELFEILKKDKYDWGEFKKYLSRELILKSKNDYPTSFKKKDKITKGGIYYWSIDDPSLNRLVELGRLLGICSFIVLKHVRFVSKFEYGKSIKTIDLEQLIGILKEYNPGMDYSKLFSVDEIMQIMDKQGIPLEVIEDAIATGKKYVIFFSGKKDEKQFVIYNGKKYYRLGFTREAFEDGVNDE